MITTTVSLCSACRRLASGSLWLWLSLLLACGPVSPDDELVGDELAGGPANTTHALGVAVDPGFGSSPTPVALPVTTGRCSATAIAAIDSKGSAKHHAVGLPVGRHQPLAPLGCARVYQRGVVVWHAVHGAHEVHGGIYKRWLDRGGVEGVLGFPTSDEQSVPHHYAARHSEFVGGSIYWSWYTGAHAVYGDIRSHWLGLGGATGPVGLPRGDRRKTLDGRGYYTRFESGAIYNGFKRPRLWVPEKIWAHWMQVGGVGHPNGWPQFPAVASGDGVYQQFEEHGFYHGALPGAPQTMQTCSTASVPHYGWAGTSAHEREAPYTEELNGIAHSNLRWFVTHNDEDPKVWSFPVVYDFSSDPGGGCETNAACWAKHAVTFKPLSKLVGEGLPAGWGHLGDADWYARPLQWKSGDPTTAYLEKLYPFQGGRLYVPLEGHNRKPIVAALDNNLKLRGWASLTGQAQAGWVAVNPTNGYVYSSNSDLAKLFIYQPVFVNGDLKQLKLLGTRAVGPGSYNGRWAQGGAFSPSGKLYVTYDRGGGDGWLDTYDLDKTRGYGPVQRIGRVGLSMNVTFGEIQGLTVVDRPSAAHGSIRGQVHVAYLDQDIDRHDWFLMHLDLLPHTRNACY